MLPYLILSYPILFSLNVFHCRVSYPMYVCPTLPYPILCYPTLPCLARILSKLYFYILNGTDYDDKFRRVAMDLSVSLASSGLSLPRVFSQPRPNQQDPEQPPTNEASPPARTASLSPLPVLLNKDLIGSPAPHHTPPQTTVAPSFHNEDQKSQIQFNRFTVTFKMTLLWPLMKSQSAYCTNCIV